MKISCGSCGAEYNIDERKIPPTGAFVTCKACSNKIRVQPPGSAPAGAPTTGRRKTTGAIPLPGQGTPGSPAPGATPGTDPATAPASAGPALPEHAPPPARPP